MCRNGCPWILLAAGLFPAIAALLLSPNDFESWGGAGIDCDGPVLLAFSIPAAGLLLAAAATFCRRAMRNQRLASFLPSILCVTLVLALVPNSLAAFGELYRADHQAACD